MNLRRAFIFAISIASLLSGCTHASEEAQLARLMRHRSWPRIQQIAKAEVQKREKLFDNAEYLPAEHKDKVWVVMAMTGTTKGDLQGVVTLMIGDDGSILAYKREDDLHRK